METTAEFQMASRTGRGGGSVQPLKEIEAAVIGDIVPVEAIEVRFDCGLLTGGGNKYNYSLLCIIRRKYACRFFLYLMAHSV